MDNAEKMEGLRRTEGTLDSPARGRGFDKVKSTIAEKLDTAAESLRMKADQAGTEKDFATRYGRQAAGWLDSTARYVRQFDVDRLKTEVENKVRQDPGRTLLIAGAVGLVLGTLIRRR